MFKLRLEHLEALRPIVRSEFPNRLKADLQKRGLPVQRELSTGDLVLADSRGHQTRIRFQPDGLPSAIQAPSGATHRLEHDSAGRLIARTWPSGERLEIGRDERGRIVELSRPDLARYVIERDEEGQPIRITYPDSTTTLFERSDTPEGHRRLKVTDRCNSTTEYVFSANGRICSIGDPLGRNITFIRTVDDRLKGIHFPDHSAEAFVYHSDSRLGMSTPRDGTAALRQYDEQGRLTRVTWHDASFLHLTYKDEKLYTATNQSTTVKFDFEEDANQLKEESDHGAIVNSIFDPDERLIGLQTTPNEAINFTYNPDGRISSVRDWHGGESFLAWSSDGFLSEIRFPNSLTVKQSVGRLGRISSCEVIDKRGKLVSRQLYSYDVNERLTGILDNTNNSLKAADTRQFSYDAEGRITQETDAGSGRIVSNFIYDKKGNLTRKDGIEVIVGLLDQPLAFGRSPIIYDGNGNMTELPVEGHQLRCEFSADGSLRKATASGKVIEFTYDAFCRRISKRSAGSEWRYGWFQHQMLWEERTLEDGQVLRRDYLWLPNSVVPFAFREQGRIYWLLADARGAIIRVFDDQGITCWSANYDSFGRIISSTGQIHQPWRLAGHYHDVETGLYYNLRRYYNPFLCSYISQDPRWFTFPATRYSYALNDPWNRVDPFGTIPLLLVVGGVLLAAAVATILIGAVASAVKRGNSALEHQAELGDPLWISCSLKGLKDGGLWGLEQVGGFFVGVGEGVVDAVVDLAGLLEGALNLSGGWIFDPESAQETWQNLNDSIRAIVDNPASVWEAFTRPIVEDWEAGRYGEAIGRSTFEGLSAVFGPGKFTKAGKAKVLGRAAGAADTVKADAYTRYLARKTSEGKPPLSYEKWRKKYDTLERNRLQGTEAEKQFRRDFGGEKPNRSIKTPDTLRYADNVKDGVIREVKSGDVQLDSSTKLQIKKDAHLVEQGHEIEWHFYGTPDPKVIKAVRDAGITPVQH